MINSSSGMMMGDSSSSMISKSVASDHQSIPNSGDELWLRLTSDGSEKTKVPSSQLIVSSCRAISDFIASDWNASVDNRRNFYYMFTKLIDRIYGEEDLSDNGSNLRYGSSRSSMRDPASRHASGNNMNTPYGTKPSRGNYRRQQSSDIASQGWLSESIGVSGTTKKRRPSSSIFDSTNEFISKAVHKNASLLSSSSSTAKSSRDITSSSSDRKDNPHNLTAPGLAILSLMSAKARDESKGSLFHLVFTGGPHPVELSLAIKFLPAPTLSALNAVSANVPTLYKTLLNRPLDQQVFGPSSPQILVTVEEYFLFYFVNFPVSRTRTNGRLSRHMSLPKRTWSSFREYGISNLIDGNPYVVLLLQYLHYFFPNTSIELDRQNMVKSISDSGTSRAVSSTRSTSSSEIFLHILIDLWLHQNSEIRSDQSNQAPSALLMVHTMGEYIAPREEVLNSLLVTVIYMLNDVSMPLQSAGNSGCLQIMQHRLLLFFRVVLPRCQVRVSPNIFFMVVDLWLAITQPWKCRDAYRSGRKSEGISTSAGNFTLEWRSYIWANYHFYTTILKLLLDRFLELDYSGKDGESHLRVLSRILGVYNSRELLPTLDDSTDVLRQQMLATTSPQRAKTLHEDSYEPESSADLQNQIQVLLFHCYNTGVKVEPIPLTSFRPQAIRLHDKLRFITNSKGVLRDDAKFCMQDIRNIFVIVDDDSISSKSTGPRSSQVVRRRPDRNESDKSLSIAGINQIIEGSRVCLPEDVQYVGDPMLQPVRSFEIPFLVEFWVSVSKYLNTCFGLGNDAEAYEQSRRLAYTSRTRMGDIEMKNESSKVSTFRFNLRILATKLFAILTLGLLCYFMSKFGIFRIVFQLLYCIYYVVSTILGFFYL